MSPIFWVELESNIVLFYNLYIIAFFVSISLLIFLDALEELMIELRFSGSHHLLCELWTHREKWYFHEMDQKVLLIAIFHTQRQYLSSRCIVQTVYTIVNWCSKNWPRIGQVCETFQRKRYKVSFVYAELPTRLFK